MAIKKNKKKEPELTLVQIANELNEVMQYGVDPETGEVDTSQQIDTELEDEALQAEILKSASEDLAANDVESFSPEVWAWFLDQGIVPAGMEEEEEEEPEEEEGEFDDDSEEEEEAEEEEEPEPVKVAPKKAPKAKKEVATPAPKAKEEKKAAAPKKVEEKKIKKQPAVREKKERGPSNETIALEMLKEGKTVEDFIKKYTQIYTERGKDKAFGEQRGRDYYGFALRATGTAAPKKTIEKKAAPKEKVEAKTKIEAKVKEKPAPKEKVESKPEKKLAKKIKK